MGVTILGRVPHEHDILHTLHLFELATEDGRLFDAKELLLELNALVRKHWDV